MAADQTTKRCHWVPRIYLRAFAADAGRRRVWRLSKKAGGAELKSIEKVAVKFHLYVPRDCGGSRDDSFEKKLARLEEWFGTPVWRALQDDMLDLGWDPLRKLVSLLAATMFLRNPNHLALVRDVHARLVELSSGPRSLPSSVEIGGRLFSLNPGDWPAFRDATEDDLKRIWIAEIAGAARYAKVFMRMRWSMLCADGPVFITTDNPVVPLHPSLRFRGLEDSGTSFIFPISPTRLLCMDHLHGEPANQYYPLKGTAAPQNLLMWRNAIEHMFSHRHPDTVCAEFIEDAERHGFA